MSDYVTCAIDDAREWLAGLARVEGPRAVRAPLGRSRFWTLDHQMAGRYFVLVTESARDSMRSPLICAYDAHSAGGPHDSPMAWFPLVPWMVSTHQEGLIDYLVLTCPEWHLSGIWTDTWSLRLPVHPYALPWLNKARHYGLWQRMASKVSLLGWEARPNVQEG